VQAEDLEFQSQLLDQDVMVLDKEQHGEKEESHQAQHFEIFHPSYLYR
jgi:hypothetical protein